MSSKAYQKPSFIEIQNVREHLLTVLTREMGQRQSRNGFVKLPNGIDTPRWNYEELRALQNAVNEERSVRGFHNLSLQNIVQVERQALGHVDYATKLTLYCAELVVDEYPRMIL